MDEEIKNANVGDTFVMRDGTSVTYVGTKADRHAFKRPNGDMVYVKDDGRLFRDEESSLDVVGKLGSRRNRPKREENLNSDLLCSSTKCTKYQCWRHCRNHSDIRATNLNPYDETRCPWYISKFERTGIERKRMYKRLKGE